MMKKTTSQKVNHLKLSEKAHFVNKIMQCHQHSEWQQVLNLFREEEDEELKKQVITISANSAMNLGRYSARTPPPLLTDSKLKVSGINSRSSQSI